jgi:cytidylate kinase
MIILICGFTGSGKSSIAKYVAKKLDYKLIHTSYILKQISKNKILDPKNTKMNKGWYEFSGLDNIRNKNHSIDIRLDNYLLDLIKKEDNLVLDSWTLTKKKGFVKVWLKSSKLIRAKRVAKRDGINLNKAKDIILKKDNFNKSHFKKLYSFKITNYSVYDIIFDAGKYDLITNCKKVYSLIKNKINH